MTPQRDATDVSRRPVDGATLRAPRLFLDAVDARYAVRDAHLFGSPARGTHGPDSDADGAFLAVIRALLSE